MEKQLILSHLLDYLKYKNIPHKMTGKVLMLQCPLCESDGLNANRIPNTSTVHCFLCKKDYNLIDIARKLEYEENPPEDENTIIHHLKEILNLNIITPIDEANTEKVLEFYVNNGFDLVPIAKNDKRPIEQNWTNKEHKDIIEWKNWIANGLNIGVKTGARSGITILDIDQKPIPKEIKELMGTTLIQESTNGFHLFYKYEEALPKTRIDELKIDIENNGGQVVVFPSTIDKVQRKITPTEISKMPDKLKEFLLQKVKVPVKTNSERIVEDIGTEEFNLALLEKGERNSSLIRLGGILRKELNIKQTEFALHILNNHICENPLPRKEIIAMVRKLDNYTRFDEKELAKKILEYLQYTEEASRNEIALAIAGTNRGEEKARIDKALAYLIKEEHVVKKGTKYCIIQNTQWKTNLVNIGIPIDFKMPYFEDSMIFNYGDLILIGSANARGKTHIAMNIIKQLIDQGRTPYYLSLESGSRWAKIALQLGIKEPEFFWDEVSDATQKKLAKKAITVVDWLCPNNYAETDKLLKHFVEKLQKTQGVAIVFMQLRDNNEWLAKDLVKQFPAFACRYVYDDDSSGEFGKFLVDKIREPKYNLKIREIPCQYNWETKELTVIKDEPPKTDEGKETQ